MDKKDLEIKLSDAQLRELPLTHPIVKEYVTQSLQKEGFGVQNAGSLLTVPRGDYNKNHVTTIVERITQFQETLLTSKEQKVIMKEYLHFLPKKATVSEMRNRYDEILDDIFENRVVEWDRIFKAVVFTSMACVKAMKKKLPEHVQLYTDWHVEYFNTYINHFISLEGGWLPNTLAQIKKKSA